MATPSLCQYVAWSPDAFVTNTNHVGLTQSVSLPEDQGVTIISGLGARGGMIGGTMVWPVNIEWVVTGKTIYSYTQRDNGTYVCATVPTTSFKFALDNSGSVGLKTFAATQCNRYTIGASAGDVLKSTGEWWSKSKPTEASWAELTYTDTAPDAEDVFAFYQSGTDGHKLDGNKYQITSWTIDVNNNLQQVIAGDGAASGSLRETDSIYGDDETIGLELATYKEIPRSVTGSGADALTVDLTFAVTYTNTAGTTIAIAMESMGMTRGEPSARTKSLGNYAYRFECPPNVAAALTIT